MPRRPPRSPLFPYTTLFRSYRVEAHVRQYLSLPHPRLAAVVGRHDPRLLVGVLLRKPTRERVGRLDHVIVDGDDPVHPLARLGFRKPGDRLAPTLPAAAMFVALQIIDRQARHVS